MELFWAVCIFFFAVLASFILGEYLVMRKQRWEKRIMEEYAQEDEVELEEAIELVDAEIVEESGEKPLGRKE